jgi:hypothetical protein
VRNAEYGTCDDLPVMAADATKSPSTRAWLLPTALFGIWACFAGLWVLGLTFDALYPVCELSPKSSIFGTSSWEWFPPGYTCIYNLDEIFGVGGIVIETPPISRAAMSLLLVLWPVSMWLLIRRGRRLGATN